MKILRKIFSIFLVLSMIMIMVLTNNCVAKANSDVCEEISILCLNGLRAANPGEKASDYNAGIIPNEGENYTVKNIKIQDSNVSSYGDGYLSNDEIFKTGHTYTVYVTLKANEGYEFSSYPIYQDQTATNIAIVRDSIDYSEVEIAYYFYIEGEIQNINLNGLRTANPGEKVSDYNVGIVPNDGENYTVKNIKIQDSNVSSYGDRYLSNDEIFKTGHTYTVYVTLKANEGYEFSSYPIYQDQTATNIAIVRDSIDYSEVEIAYYFYIEGEIQNINLNGLRTANPGEKVSDYNVGIVPNDGENYTVKNIKIEDSNVSSYGDRYLSNDEIFKTGHTYVVYVTLKANEGYEFSSYPRYQDGTATNIAIVRDSIDYSEVEIAYYFYIEGEIQNINLNGLKTANPGEKASDYNAGIIPNEGENYTVKNIKIQDSNVSLYRDGYLSNDEIFKTGHTYTVYVTLKANEGYEFSSYPIYQDGTATNIAIVRDSIDYSEVEITYYFYIDEKVVLSNPTVAATYNSDKSVKLTWTPVEDAKYYQIYKYYASTGKIQKSKIVEGTETYFYNLKDSTTYRYIVQAVGDNGESDNVSKDYVVDIKAGKPISGAITNILFNYTNNYLELSWEKVDNVSKYYVYKYYTSSKTLSNPKEVKNTSCRYNIKKSNTSVKYLVSTEKLENLSGYDGRGCICVRVCK